MRCMSNHGHEQMRHLEMNLAYLENRKEVHLAGGGGKEGRERTCCMLGTELSLYVCYLI